MEKYLIIIIIIMILYFIQKYCIQSEVEKILITKNIIEKFTDSNTNFSFSNVVNNLQQSNSLDISGSLIINNKHTLMSDGNYLKLTDVSGQNFLNMSVNNLDVSGELLVRQNSTFTGGPHNFNFLNIDTSGNNAGIKSLQGNLTINGSKTILGNTDISGNLRINNVKPILIKIFTTTGNIIDTGVSHSVYSGIGFSGYNHPTPTSTRIPSEFNTYKQNGNWYVSFAPTNTQQLSIRLIFFNTFFHNDESIDEVPNPPTDISATLGNSLATVTWVPPTNTGSSPIRYYIVRTFQGSTIIKDISSNTISATVTDLTNGLPYSFSVYALNTIGFSTESVKSSPVTPNIRPNAPTNLRAVGNTQATLLSWDAPATNGGSPITLYTISDGSGITQTSTTNSKLVTGLSNGKMYTFTITATNATYTSVPSASIDVLPLAMTPITIGTDFVGKTLVIASRALTSSTSHWERIFDFHKAGHNSIDPLGTYIIGPFTYNHHNNNFLFTFKKVGNVNESMNYHGITTNALTRNVTYLYVLAFSSTTQVTFNIYEYTNNYVMSKGSTTTISITNNSLSLINNFWLGRASNQWDVFYNGNYSKIALYNGNLFTETNITTILLNLVTGTSPNITSYINSADYAFRPVLNNFMGVIVRRLSVGTTVAAGAAATTSDITLVGTGSTSGGFLNIIGSFIEVPSAPTNVSAINGPNTRQATVSWSLSTNNGGSPITGYRVTSNPGGISVPVSSTTTSTPISGLTSGTAYTFSVVAINAEGDSLSSTSTSITSN